MGQHIGRSEWTNLDCVERARGRARTLVRALLDVDELNLYVICVEMGSYASVASATARRQPSAYSGRYTYSFTV
jgi:hypothetical protein